MDPLSLDFVLISSVIIFFAYFIKGITGFGSGPIRNSLWLFFIDIKFAAPAGVLFAILSNTWILRGSHSCINRRLLIWVGAGSVLGVVIGTFLLVSSPSAFLSVLFGVFLLLYGIFDVFKPIKRHSSSRIADFLIGALSGAVGGLFGAGSAVIIAFWLDRAGLKKDEFRGTLVLIYLVGNIASIAVYAAAGLYTLELLEFTVLMLPVFFIALSLGNKIYPRISEKNFKKIVGILLAAIGALLIVKFLL